MVGKALSQLKNIACERHGLQVGKFAVDSALEFTLKRTKGTHSGGWFTHKKTAPAIHATAGAVLTLIYVGSYWINGRAISNGDDP